MIKPDKSFAGNTLGFATSKMRSFPNIINIEIFRGICQCSCIHCPVGKVDVSDRKEKFGIKHMELALYKKIVNEVCQYKHATLRFHSVGEPLLWKNLSEALILAFNLQVKIWIFTNALIQDRNLLKQICHYTKIIEISINSIDAKDYQKTKGTDGFSKVVDNIKWLRQEILKNKLDTRMIVSRVESDNQELDQNFVIHWKQSGLVDDAIIRSYHTYNGLLDNKFSRDLFLRRDPCLVHWARFNIGASGDVVICFNELFKDPINPASILGNIKNQSIKEIWHSTKLDNIRRAELLHDYSLCQDWGQLPCKYCNSCQPLRSEKKSSEHQISQL